MINTVLDNLKLTRDVFRNLIVTSNYKKITDNEISWDKYNSGIFKNLYAKEYEFLIRTRQYSFLLKEDKGFIQFYYHFAPDGVLNKLKMCYYPYPIELRENVEDVEVLMHDSDDLVLEEYYYDLWNILNHNFELSVDDENLEKALKKAVKAGNTDSREEMILGKFENKYKFTNSSHFRIDYDSKVTSHHKTEIQVGSVNDIRLPIDKIISPFLFFDFIAKNLFKKDKDYQKIISTHQYPTQRNISKKLSYKINPFKEDNIFTSHL